MDNLDIALLVYLNDEESSKDEKNRLEESVMFKNHDTEGAFQILVRHHLHFNAEKFSFSWAYLNSLDLILYRAS